MTWISLWYATAAHWYAPLTLTNSFNIALFECVGECVRKRTSGRTFPQLQCFLMSTWKLTVLHTWDHLGQTHWGINHRLPSSGMHSLLPKPKYAFSIISPENTASLITPMHWCAVVQYNNIIATACNFYTLLASKIAREQRKLAFMNSADGDDDRHLSEHAVSAFSPWKATSSCRSNCAVMISSDIVYLIIIKYY